jgi:hypothetical protein
VANLFVSPARDDVPRPDKPAPKRLVAFSEDGVCFVVGFECPEICCHSKHIDQARAHTVARGSQQSATAKDEGDDPTNFVGVLKQHLASITSPRSLLGENRVVRVSMQAFQGDIKYASL